MKVPFVSFAPMNAEYREEAISEFSAFFDSNYYVLGTGVATFEDAYARFNATRFCVGVGNGLDAIHLSLRALGISEGDEVIIPSHTYIATALAVTYTGATPVFVEPKPDTYNIDPEQIEAAITPSTKAIIPVHLYGQACEMEKIMEIADRFSIPVIEDNAQAQGATYNGRMTGSFGKVNATSFYPGKNLGALGDAGAITTNDADLFSQLKMLRNYGSKEKYNHEIIGYNSRIDEVQARMLSIKLKYLPQWSQARQYIANQYNELLKGIKEIKLPAIADGATSVYHLYVIEVDDRDGLQAHLSEMGITTLIHYPIPIHLQKAYAGLNMGVGSFPVAERLAKRILSLPLYPGISESQIGYVASVISNFYSGTKS
jgi:dTDP-4-amino-4,6-dideoxygalactose transaminase